jgi:hypothetical protein
MIVARPECPQRDSGLERSVRPRAHAVRIARDPRSDRDLGEELDLSRGRAIAGITPERSRAIRDPLDIEQLRRFRHARPSVSS